MAPTPFAVLASSLSNAKSYRYSRNVNTAPLNATDGTTTNYRPSEFDKKILVWNKKFPSLKEVPARVSQLTMERARNMTRIKMNVLLTVITAVACLGVIASGKLAAKTGDSVTRRNLEWHHKYNRKV